MKIIILTSNYPRKNAMMNGFFIHQQVRALHQLGVECHVILTYNWFPPFGLHRLHPYWRLGYAMKKNFLNHYEEIPIHHVAVKIKMPSRFFPENKYERDANAIVHQIKANEELHDVDWLYAQFLTDCGYIGTFIKDRIGIKLAAIARGDDVHAWPEKDPRLITNLQTVFEKADKLFANSAALGRDVKKWFKGNFDREVLTIYNGVDLARFRPLENIAKKRYLRSSFSIDGEFNLLLCVATPVVEKGWLDLLDALKLIKENFSGWKLVSVTPPRISDLNLVDEAKKRGLEGYFLLIGSVDPERMPTLYQMADAFVLPSHNEGFSNSVLEALSSGLPVIATSVGGHGEYLRDNLNCLLIEPFNVGLLANSILRIISSAEIRKRLAIEARILAEEIGSYELNASRLIKELAIL